jgi:hypothetical protein
VTEIEKGSDVAGAGQVFLVDLICCGSAFFVLAYLPLVDIVDRFGRISG